MMQIDIWSDVVCPFCYIGKKHLELAIEDLGMKDQVKIEYKSFQLDPQAAPSEGQTLKRYLAESKGMTMEQVEQMSQGVVERANAVGLSFDLDNAIVANTFNAHRLLHLAKERQVQNDLKEALLEAYFTNGANLNNKETLATHVAKVGLDKEEVLKVLTSNSYSSAFRDDVNAARQMGIQGVPFFVFNKKYAISGAQPIEAFKQALQQIKIEMENEGEICSVEDPNC